MKIGLITNIEKGALANINFRHVLYTGKYLQLALMSLKLGEDIGKEVHADIDQFIKIESGSGVAIVNDIETAVGDGDVILIPAGAEHNVVNTGESIMKLYTIYGSPEHKDGIIQETKVIAHARHHEEQFDGVTTE